MSNKYRDITNLAELEAAERKLRLKLSRKEEALVRQLYGLRDNYSPSNLLGMTARESRMDTPILQAIRFLKKKIASL